MRNQVFWTENLEKTRERTLFPVIDVSQIVSQNFDIYIDDLLSDPSSTVKKILNDQFDQAVHGLILTNIGILLEPELQVSVVKLLLDYAVSYDVILFWPYSIKNGRILSWDVNDSTSSIEFSDHILQHMEIDV